MGIKHIEYDIPIMEKYLKDTYGITVYQEQVMLLSRLLADFTRGESDALRKAMGKKTARQAGPYEAEVHCWRTEGRTRCEGARKDLGGLGEVLVLCFSISLMPPAIHGLPIRRRS